MQDTNIYFEKLKSEEKLSNLVRQRTKKRALNMANRTKIKVSFIKDTTLPKKKSGIAFYN